MQNKSKHAFPSDIRKNSKDCMVVTLRSGKEVESRKEEEKKKTEKVEGQETGKENTLSNLDSTEETKNVEEQTEQ